jgi:hypothetical protein
MIRHIPRIIISQNHFMYCQSYYNSNNLPNYSEIKIVFLIISVSTTLHGRLDKNKKENTVRHVERLLIFDRHGKNIAKREHA